MALESCLLNIETTQDTELKEIIIFIIKVCFSSGFAWKHNCFKKCLWGHGEWAQEAWNHKLIQSAKGKASSPSTP